MSKYREYTSDIIRADPIGATEYGDTTDLEIDHARLLLAELERLAEVNPSFRGWVSTYTVKGIARVELVDTIKRIISSKQSPQILRYIILESIEGSQCPKHVSHELATVVMDASEPMSLRSAALERLFEADAISEWVKTAEQLRVAGDRNSGRLAVNVIRHACFDGFGYSQIADIIFSAAGISLSPHRRKRTQGRLRKFLRAMGNLCPHLKSTASWM